MTPRLNFTEFVDFILARLYELDQAGTGTSFQDVDAIAAELREPVPDDWASQAVDVLAEQGLVDEANTMGAAAAVINGRGRLYVEGREHQTEVIEEYRQQPSNFVYVTGTGHQVAVGVGGNVTQVKVSTDVRDSALRLLETMREKLDEEPTLGPSAKEDVLRDVAAIEGQFKKNTLNKDAVIALLNPLANIAGIADLAVSLGQVVQQLS